MERGVVVALAMALGAGGVGTVQVLVNAALGGAIGSYQAGMVSGLGTALVLAVASLPAGGFGRLGSDPVRWHYAVGILGAGYLVASLVAVRALGAAGLTASLIAGQFAVSLAIDHLGLLGAAREAITAPKMGGLALIAGGVYLIVRP